jgi:hypothetical protein
MAPIDYVSDYEEVTGQKPAHEPASKKTKVVTADKADVETKD